MSNPLTPAEEADQAAAAPALPVDVTNLAPGAHLLYSGGCDLVGWSVMAPAAASTLTLLDGPDPLASVVGVESLAALDSATHGPVQSGVRVDTGLVAVITGALVGSVYIRPHERD